MHLNSKFRRVYSTSVLIVCNHMPQYVRAGEYFVFAALVFFIGIFLL